MNELVVTTKEALQELLTQVLRDEMAGTSVEPFKPLYPYDAACALLGKPRTTLDRWARAGIIEKAVIGGCAFVSGESIARYFNRRSNGKKPYINI